MSLRSVSSCLKRTRRPYSWTPPSAESTAYASIRWTAPPTSTVASPSERYRVKLQFTCSLQYIIVPEWLNGKGPTLTVIRMVFCSVLFSSVDLWDLHDQRQGQRDSGGRTATRDPHDRCWLLHVWEFMHGTSNYTP